MNIYYDILDPRKLLIILKIVERRCVSVIIMNTHMTGSIYKTYNDAFYNTTHRIS